MAGFLTQAEQPQQAQQAPNSEMVNMDQARASMNGTMDTLKRLVVAGQTILYSKQAGDKFLQFLDKENIPQSVGQIAAMVVVALIDKAGEKAAPPNLIVPAGALIAADLLDYACKLYEVEMTDELSKATLTAFAESMQRGVSQGQPQQPPQDQFAQQAQAQQVQGVPQGVPA